MPGLLEHFSSSSGPGLAQPTFLVLLMLADSNLLDGSNDGSFALLPILAMSTFGFLNLLLLVFNLLPSFPLDGGNVARQALSWFMRDGLALKIVAVCGMALGAVFALLSQTYGNGLLFLAFFMVFENWQIFQAAR